MLALCLLAFLPLQDPPPPPPDQFIVGRNKRKVSGVLLRSTEDTLWIGKGTRVMELDAEKVRERSGPRVVYPQYISRLYEDYSKGANAERSLALVDWCRENGLTRDLRFHYLRALVDDPDNEVAHQALGHRRLRGRWRGKVGNGRSISWQELQEYHMDVATPWEIDTFHFHVRGAGRLIEVLNACADLEHLYRAYFQTFQESVGFYELQKPIEVLIYPDADSFPEQANTLDAYWDPSGRQLYTYFRDGKASLLRREGTIAILHATVREHARDEPDLPGWIEEGIAAYMEACMEGPPGSSSFNPDRVNFELFEAHVYHENPDSLTRVLNYSPGDFSASSNQMLKYGQSYTLAHFLLHGGDEKQLEGFSRFLISCYDRKGSMSHFKNAMEIRDLDPLEEAWTTYAQTRLGEGS
ncbi:MAG: hypothetical protein DWQ01_10250 [Planctomycetota bacterium]|nr:MAG: hypothetical protein DWQ01_10250 [Planctomycetota bacterium]